MKEKHTLTLQFLFEHRYVARISM